MIRMWQVCSDGQPVWRTSAEDAHTGERRAFADLTGLIAFLQQTTNQDKETVL